MPIAVQTPLLLKVWKYDAEFTVLTVTQSAKAEIGKIAIKIRSTQSRENMRLCMRVSVIVIPSFKK